MRKTSVTFAGMFSVSRKFVCTRQVFSLGKYALTSPQLGSVKAGSVREACSVNTSTSCCNLEICLATAAEIFSTSLASRSSSATVAAAAAAAAAAAVAAPSTVVSFRTFVHALCSPTTHSLYFSVEEPFRNKELSFFVIS
jgi:hypothetical protein